MSEAPIVIGLVGGAGSGRDRAAAVMARFGFCSLALAEAMRIEISQAWRVDRRILSDRAHKERPLPELAVAMCTDQAFVRRAVDQQHDLLQPRSPRWAMQHWGTNFRRAQNPAYWVRVVEALAWRQLDAGSRRIVISDVRLHNEAELVRRLGGTLLRVHGSAQSPIDADARRHVSESQWGEIQVDDGIRNEGAPIGLEQEVEDMLLRMFPAIQPVEVIKR